MQKFTDTESDTVFFNPTDTDTNTDPPSLNETSHLQEVSPRKLSAQPRRADGEVK